MIEFLVFLFLSHAQVYATTVTESFTTSTNKDTSQMVWNISRGELHPPLIVIGYDRGFGSENFPFSVGDGHHGSFSSANDYARLSCASVASSTITVNTDVCDDLQFRDFHLLSGYTLRGNGNKPLKIRSLSTVIVDGIIDCSGGDGADGTSTSTAVSAGGLAKCGGGDGGASVLPLAAPGLTNQGVSGGTFASGGSGGPIQNGSAGKGGGGGGAYVKSFTGGTDSPDGTSGLDSASASLGNVGSNRRDDAFGDDLDGAGSGGGGGSAFESGVDPGNSSGGGGGAGGGSIQIYAADSVTVTGSVLANGGNGGIVSVPLKAGAGGGGGGGSILIMTVGDVVNNGTVSAVAGIGGAAFANSSGGNGYWGRTWVVEKDGYGGGLNLETPETKLNVPGDVRYETGVTYTVQSKAIDLMNSRPTLLSSLGTVANQGGATFTLELAFGESETDPALSNFALASTYATKDVGRFVKFRLQLDNLNAVTPAVVTDLSLTFDGFLQTQFQFAGACGRVEGESGQSGILLLWLLPLLSLLFLRLRYSKLPAKAIL